MDELLRWRDEFPILKTTTYLISNSLGAMPRGVASALEEYARTWASRGVRAWEEGWWEMGATVGDEIAPITGADPASRMRAARPVQGPPPGEVGWRLVMEPR
jgi:kynureninase